MTESILQADGVVLADAVLLTKAVLPDGTVLPIDAVFLVDAVDLAVVSAEVHELRKTESAKDLFLSPRLHEPESAPVVGQIVLG